MSRVDSQSTSYTERCVSSFTNLKIKYGELRSVRLRANLLTRSAKRNTAGSWKHRCGPSSSHIEPLIRHPRNRFLVLPFLLLPTLLLNWLLLHFLTPKPFILLYETLLELWLHTISLWNCRVQNKIVCKKLFSSTSSMLNKYCILLYMYYIIWLYYKWYIWFYQVV